MKIREAIFQGRDRLAAASIQCADPLLHMKQIAEFCLGLPLAELYLKWEDELSPDAAERIEAFLKRRLGGEPFQYIAGHEHFWEGKFEVGPGVLIPRRETEILVEALLEEDKRPSVRVAELGAGSGNIGLSVLHERRGWEWFGYEKNPASLPFLETNRKSLLPSGSVYHVRPGDYFELAPADGPFDWIVSNAPYVTTGELPTLAQEVRREPAEALDGGTDGLDVIRRLVATAPKLLKSGGGIAGEMAFEQAGDVLKLLLDSGFRQSRVIRDYSGLDRVFLARWGEI